MNFTTFFGSFCFFSISRCLNVNFCFFVLFRKEEMFIYYGHWNVIWLLQWRHTIIQNRFSTFNNCVYGMKMLFSVFCVFFFFGSGENYKMKILKPEESNTKIYRFNSLIPTTEQFKTTLMADTDRSLQFSCCLLNFTLCIHFWPNTIACFPCYSYCCWFLLHTQKTILYFIIFFAITFSLPHQ